MLERGFYLLVTLCVVGVSEQGREAECRSRAVVFPQSVQQSPKFQWKTGVPGIFSLYPKNNLQFSGLRWVGNPVLHWEAHTWGSQRSPGCRSCRHPQGFPMPHSTDGCPKVISLSVTSSRNPSDGWTKTAREYLSLSGGRNEGRGSLYFNPLSFKEQDFANLAEHRPSPGSLWQWLSELRPFSGFSVVNLGWVLETFLKGDSEVGGSWAPLEKCLSWRSCDLSPYRFDIPVCS